MLAESELSNSLQTMALERLKECHISRFPIRVEEFPSCFVC
jgi:hypothetical protein